MIKSNRNMKEIIPFDRLKPLHAEGHFCLDLTDPLTGKVKERIDGKNMVFPEQLFMGAVGGAYESNGYSSLAVAPWNDPGQRGLDKVFLCLNDSQDAVDPAFPFLRGQTVGYGRPGLGSLNTFRGAYNAANQVLGECSLTKQRWKFQYDFTTAQANVGTIRTAGLTHQYLADLGGFRGMTKHAMHAGNRRLIPSSSCNGGRYSGYIPVNSAAGIVTVYDTQEDTVTTRDLSATIGVSSAEKKYIGCAPLTGKWYIYKYSSTAANRRVWVFSDQTFSNLEATYTVSNIAIWPASNADTCFYVYGNKMYLLQNAMDQNASLYIADFVANTAHTTWVWPGVSALNNTLKNEGYTGSGYLWGVSSLGDPAGIWLLDYSGGAVAVLYDPVTGNAAVQTITSNALNCQNGVFYHPLLTGRIPTKTAYYSNINYYIQALRGALTTYVLPTPVTKTSANGMTVTYELEVFW